MPSYKDQLYGYYYDDAALAHHGVKGQKWGVRRYQNADGTLTSEGRKHVQSMNPEKVGFTVRNTVDYYKNSVKSVGTVAKGVKNKKIPVHNTLQALGASNRSNLSAFSKNQAEMLTQRRIASEKKGGNKTVIGRTINDSRRSRAAMQEKNANVWNARSTLVSDPSLKNLKSVGKSYVDLGVQAYKSAYGYGTYNRLRENGESKAKALLKTATLGSFAK